MCICTHALFQIVSETELFQCTVPKLLIKEILSTVSNTGIYYSSDDVGTVYSV
jgi:hypothetical protein